MIVGKCQGFWAMIMGKLTEWARGVNCPHTAHPDSRKFSTSISFAKPEIMSLSNSFVSGAGGKLMGLGVRFCKRRWRNAAILSFPDFALFISSKTATYAGQDMQV